MTQLLPLAAFSIIEMGLLVWIVRAPHRAIWVLISLLPLHLVAMVLIYHFLQPPKSILSIYQGWKDAIIGVTLVRVALDRRGRAGQTIHYLDIGFGLLAVIATTSIALHATLGLPQQLLALRNDYLFLLLYAIGRLSWAPPGTIDRTLLLIAAVWLTIALGAGLEVLVNPTRLLLAIDLPGYDKFNFQAIFLHDPPLPYSFYTSDNHWRAGSLLLSPVDLAESSAVAIGAGLALARARGTASLSRRFMNTAGLITVVAGLFTTIASRGRAQLLLSPVLIAVGAAPALAHRVPWRNIDLRLRIVLSASLTALACLGLVIVMPDAVPFLVRTLHLEDPSSLSHFNALRRFTDAFSHNWLIGGGLGTSGSVGARFGATAGEGQLLTITSDLGDIGLLLAVGLLLASLVHVLRVPHDSELRRLATVAAVGLTAIILILPIAEVFSNLLLMSITFWTLGQIVRLQTSTAIDGDAEVIHQPMGPLARHEHASKTSYD